jgi:cation-transporting ATPase F
MYTYLPAMNDLFGSAPLNLTAWLECAAVALIAYLVVELAKRLTGTDRRPIRP